MLKHVETQDAHLSHGLNFFFVSCEHWQPLSSSSTAGFARGLHQVACQRRFVPGTNHHVECDSAPYTHTHTHTDTDRHRWTHTHTHTHTNLQRVSNRAGCYLCVCSFGLVLTFSCPHVCFVCACVFLLPVPTVCFHFQGIDIALVSVFVSHFKGR